MNDVIYEYGCEVTSTKECPLNEEIRADERAKFAHELKEVFNAEFPSNYRSTQPFFTLENVRMIVDMVAKEQK